MTQGNLTKLSEQALLIKKLAGFFNETHIINHIPSEKCLTIDDKTDGSPFYDYFLQNKYYTDFITAVKLNCKIPGVDYKDSMSYNAQLFRQTYMIER